MEREGEGTKFTIDRKIFSSDIWFASPWKLKIWIYLIGHANHEDNRFMGFNLKRGQLIRSLRKIRKDCGYKVGYRMKYPSLDTIRRICEDLTKDDRIVQRSVHQGTLFTICNYDDLQTFPNPRSVQRSDKSSYSSRTVVVQDKNTKNVKKDKDIYGEFKNVHLTKDEFNKLEEKFDHERTSYWIEQLSAYIESKGKRYKSHYATILNWDRKRGGENGKKGVYSRHAREFWEAMESQDES